ncbi:MAG: hypothetical protein B6D59_08095 [Campylobacteraceae bacterium 4484_4]|nr:MAG: hypothetical protein B6D59_08095 [Campylobacteraceae bacterium 4484_4]
MKDTDLDQLIICEKCDTLHKKIPLSYNQTAYCSHCHSPLYKNHPHLIAYTLSIALTTLVFFVMANLFPIVTVDIKGMVSSITLPSVIVSLFEQHFFIVGLLVSFVIFLFPLSILLSLILALTLMLMQKGEEIVKALLLYISHVNRWNMMEIFLISILVALVKLIGYGEIYFGVSFWALVLFVVSDLFLTKDLHIRSLWEHWQRIYHD